MKIMNLTTLVDIIASVSGVEKKNILGKERYRKFVIPRYIFSYVAKRRYGYTFEEIGEALGTHHSTVIYSVSKVKDLLDIEDEYIVPIYKGVVEAIEKISQEPIKVIVEFDNCEDVNLAIVDLVQRYGCKAYKMHN
jgi:chromosomal replication initiation ATPase DnaA